jgi:hypothetical protein
VAVSPEEAWAAYEATLPRLEAARVEHDEAYTASQIAYKRWLAVGGDPKPKEGHGT